jgi:hypothetical protein
VQAYVRRNELAAIYEACHRVYDACDRVDGIVNTALGMEDEDADA